MDPGIVKTKISLANKIVIIFFLAQIVGIYTGTVITKDIEANPYIAGLVITSDTNSISNAFLFMGYILIGAIFMLLIIKYLGKIQIVLKLMEFVMISSSSSIAIYAVARAAFDYDSSMLAGIIIGLVLAGIKLVTPDIKNITAIVATAGVGTVFGVSLGLIPLAIFLVMLAVYDYLAVFKTRHMVSLANFIVKEDLAFTITAKGPPKWPDKQEQRIDLGTGDMIAPIMFEVAILQYGPAAVGMVLIGATLSLALFINYVWKKKMVLPALPPIVFGMLCAFLLGLLIGFY